MALQEGKGKQGKQPQDGLAGIISAGSGVQGAVPGCLVPGPGVLGQGDGGLECESPTEKVVGTWALDWFWLAFERHSL